MSNRLLWLLFVVGCTGPAGQQGEQGDPGPQGDQGPAGSDGSGSTSAASINVVTPRHGFLGRKVEIEISGNNTAFDTSTIVDFGANVTVDKIAVASPTLLVASLSIADAAATGDRDVTVHMGTTTLVATKGFSIDASLGVSIVGGPLVQGDIAYVNFKNLDTVPLVTATGLVPNQIDIQGGVLIKAASYDSLVVYEAFIDVDAAPGPRTVVFPDAGFGATRFVADKADVAITARTPTAITLPYNAAVVFDTHSKAFQVQTSTLGILSVTGDPGASLSAIAELATGTPQAALDAAPVVNGLASVTRATATITNLVIGANDSVGNDANHTLQLAVIHTPVASLTAESGTAHDRNSAQVLTSPAILDGTLTASGEEDAYKVSVPAGGHVEMTVAITGNAAPYVIIPQGVVDASASQYPRSFHFTNFTGSTAQYGFAFGYFNAAASYTLSVRTY